ncbi:MAG: 23S rRNA (adenine(2503)-C(2))-methyltransferase RlmN [Armatimonadota bacterium]|nr:23S rRNA (adenine(2503)-C(2))-methyltransferase RlmN [bacterium]
MELFGRNRAELESFCKQLGHSSFRSKQIADWLYKRGARDFSEMTNLPGALREELAESSSITRAEIVKQSKSPDGTVKYLLKLGDGETVETVLLPYPDRVSVCVSSQIGCSAGCTFCATAESGLVRNLTAGEIVDQVLTLQEHSGKRVTHVVFMGMGEPLMNMPNVLKAIHLLNEEVGIAMRRLTISTVGITPAIGKLAEMDLQLTLAISLHAPDDALRQKLIPLASKFPLRDLIQACRNYADRTKRRITFEYLLIAGTNDSPTQAVKLAKLLKGILCHVNLIPYNEVHGKPYARPSRKVVAAFKEVLEREGVEVTQRMERGHSISGACGQLRRSERLA